MRLIDANKVLLTKDERILGYVDINAALKLQMMKIVNAPTVEAIPIEWIKNWLDNCDEELFDDVPISTYCDGYQSNVIECLLNSWEKENE